jgi:hypothetical protein
MHLLFDNEEPIGLNSPGKIVAAPVGHIVCALALLNSGTITIADNAAFLAGTSFPDIRYISNISRASTHQSNVRGLRPILETQNSFEAGRLFHVFVDREREKHMQQYDAYRFVKSGPLGVKLLKIIEDHILFEKLAGCFNADQVFDKIYQEERNTLVSESDLQTWHNLLLTYLNPNHWFSFTRYYQSLVEFQKAYNRHAQIPTNFWQHLKTFGFFVYVYFHIETLSRNQELRSIVLDFYENKIERLIRNYEPLAKEKLPTLKVFLDKRNHSPVFFSMLLNKT